MLFFLCGSAPLRLCVEPAIRWANANLLPHDAVEAAGVSEEVEIADDDGGVGAGDVGDGGPVDEVGGAFDAVDAAALAGDGETEGVGGTTRVGDSRARGLDGVED